MDDDLTDRLRALAAQWAERSYELSAALNEAAGRIAALEADGIHSCHDGCPRIACVQQRRISALEAERADIALAVRWAPSSAHWHQRLIELLGPDVWQGWDAMSARADAAECERNHLRELCAAVYQAVGAADGPVEMLDNLNAAANGQPLPHKPGAGLPWAPPAVAENAALRAALQAERAALEAAIDAARGAKGGSDA